MPKLLLLLILATAPSWAITCSGLATDEVTPHSAAFHLTTDVNILYIKLRWGTAALTENTQGVANPTAGVAGGDPVRHYMTGAGSFHYLFNRDVNQLLTALHTARS